jgi:nitrosocyanin
MTIRHRLRLSAWLAAAALFVGLAPLVTAGEVELTVVNIETPQGVKIWEPSSVVAKKGDTVKLKLINRHADEHGYEIAAFGIKEVVDGNKTKDISFTASRAGIFPIKCHLHPAHVVGQLVVLD